VGRQPTARNAVRTSHRTAASMVEGLPAVNPAGGA
jgi:hypothetical protein